MDRTVLTTGKIKVPVALILNEYVARYDVAGHPILPWSCRR